MSRRVSGLLRYESPSSDVDRHLPRPQLDHAWGTISRVKSGFCGLLNGGPTAKRLAVFLQCEMTRLADFVAEVG
jgi:hypothetical protein